MNCSRHKFFAGSGLTQDEDSAEAGSDGGQNFKYTLHERTPAGKISGVEFPFEFLAKGFQLGKIPKSLGTTDYASTTIP